MNAPEHASFRDALDIVFANRNKTYGAYALRRGYEATLLKSLALGLLLIALLLLLPRLLHAFHGAFAQDATQDADFVTHAVKVELPPVVPPVPPPPTTPPPPARSSTRFVPPVVLEDEKVAHEDPPAQASLAAAAGDIGAQTRSSDLELPPELLPEPDFGGGGIVPTQAAVPEEPYELFDVSRLPSFPGGERAMLEFLSKNVLYPAAARESHIVGTVVLSFVVEKDGSIGNILILKDIGGGCGKAAVQAVQAMPAWMPGEANGHPVRVRFTLPVRYHLQ